MRVNHAVQHVLMLVGAVAILSGCTGLTPDDPAATLRAERDGYFLEATAIADAGVLQRTQIIETAAAAATTVSQLEARNALLLATLRAALPPTQQVVNTSGLVTPGSVATPAPPGTFDSASNSAAVMSDGAPISGSSFVDITTASSVRDTDGCVDVASSAFAADISRIYITARAVTIAAGTVMRVEWAYQGSPAFSESFTIERDNSDFCLWFYIEPTADVLSPGVWTAQLYADDQTVEPIASFTIGV
ncbi:MAG: hypothetical protein SGJ24_07595 [Chloroflexota bacterium]|nr:hypothetical protein [Chloroflexota bacterium]